MSKLVPYQYKRNVSKFFAPFLLSVPFGCGISLMIAIITNSLINKFVSWQFGPISFLLLLLITITIPVINATWYISLTITKDFLAWNTLIGKAYQFHPDEISKAVWQKGKIILNQNHTIHLNKFPLKTRLEISTILSDWIPENAVTFEMQQFQQWKRNLPDKIDLIEQSAETNRKKGVILRWISTVALIILMMGFVWAFFVEPIDNILFIVVFLGGVILLIFLSLLSATRFRRIQINNKGLVYRKGKQEKLFPWDKIETIAFRSREQQILVWTGKRYQSLSYAGMNLNAVNQVLHAIYLEAMAKDIYFGMV